MDIFTIQEEAYKRGYEAGVKSVGDKMKAADRERLIELLDKAPGHANNEIYSLDEIAEFLIANGVVISNSETTTRWIPVTERLPVDWCPVLVMVREVEKPLLGSYRENVWFHERWNTTFINGAVTHWMPLPEPPKGE